MLYGIDDAAIERRLNSPIFPATVRRRYVRNYQKAKQQALASMPTVQAQFSFIES